MSDEDKLAIEHKRALRSLTEHPGWGILVAIINGQRATREQQIILTPLSESFTANMQEYMKGECASFRSVVALPGILTENLEAEINDERDADTTDESGDESAGYNADLDFSASVPSFVRDTDS